MLGEIIAEIGSVHDGSFGNACRLIDVAADVGADWVKFQTHIAEAEMIPGAPTPVHFADEPREQYFTRTGFTESEWVELAGCAIRRGTRFISSPFSIEAVELLERAGVSAYKVASGEVSNIPLLDRIAQTGKRVFLSSGMSGWAELDAAVAALNGGGGLTIMQCTSAYPCPPERIGLNVIAELRERYGCAVGFSDHSTGPAAVIAAATLGATTIEKHLTFSRLMYGSDAAYAMEPDDFRNMAAWLREVWHMLENPVDKDDLSDVADMKRVFEKSIVTSHALPEGQVVGLEDLDFKKPGDGMSPARLSEVLGHEVRRPLPADHKIMPDDLG